ncbi:hypothetical protein BC832DRAFT_537210 [Gaertneriomyces semiglobifer]|nr:hypothetical protein BC832DRAFT_537210 [Gaertneriomyces semiglobifer]
MSLFPILNSERIGYSHQEGNNRLNLYGVEVFLGYTPKWDAFVSRDTFITIPLDTWGSTEGDAERLSLALANGLLLCRQPNREPQENEKRLQRSRDMKCLLILSHQSTRTGSQEANSDPLEDDGLNDNGASTLHIPSRSLRFVLNSRNVRQAVLATILESGTLVSGKNYMGSRIETACSLMEAFNYLC